jgi:hypothetical protein
MAKVKKVHIAIIEPRVTSRKNSSMKGKPYRRRTLIMADLLTKQATFFEEVNCTEHFPQLLFHGLGFTCGVLLILC